MEEALAKKVNNEDLEDLKERFDALEELINSNKRLARGASNSPARKSSMRKADRAN